MCMIVGAEAHLSATVVYAAEVLHPTEGPVHVIGYQNTVESHGRGPSAMILPLPTDVDLGPDNALDGTGALKETLKAYRDAVEMMKPRLHEERLSLGNGTKGLPDNDFLDLQVFDKGSYTICLAKSAPHLHAAADQVPEDRRPNIPNSFIIELSKAYPKTPMALCCFNGSFEAEPLFWWYKPRNPEILFAPAIDAHDGSPPRPGKVLRDHTLVFGSYRAQGRRDGAGVANDLPTHWALTDAIVGSQVHLRQTDNGDFIFRIDDILDPKVPGYIGADQVRVQLPPGWA